MFVYHSRLQLTVDQKEIGKGIEETIMPPLDHECT